jgi:RHS repeat-associated protein
MSQAKPEDPVNRSEPRVVLLVTDRSQSIIGEIVDGQIKTIGYSAYGEQSAQQKVETRLGFNGQLREADIGWYLLGNGYRAYNPRLMRFHSPDSLSPFGKGGLNAYMYCGGEPVMNSDPTGHLRIKLANPVRALPQRVSVIVENPNASKLIPKAAAEISSVKPNTKNPIAVPVAALDQPSPIINNTNANAVAPSISSSSLTVNAPHTQSPELQGMPKLKTMIDIYQQPLVRGKRKMPELSISATEEEIKKIPRWNPVVYLNTLLRAPLDQVNTIDLTIALNRQVRF